MGMSSSNCRLLQITSRLVDLEKQAQEISNSKIRNAVRSEALATAYTDVLANGTDAEIQAATATFEAQNAVLAAQDKMFDMDLQNIDTEHTAAQTEVDSVKKIIKGDIDRNIKIFTA